MIDYQILPFNPKTGTPGDLVMLRDGGLKTVSGKEGLKQRVRYALLCRKGFFIYYDIGSHLWQIPRDFTAGDTAARQAEAWAVEAVTEQLPGEITEVIATAAIWGDGLYLDVKYVDPTTGEPDSIRITWEDMQNA
jgi:hypothetical protein